MVSGLVGVWLANIYITGRGGVVGSAYEAKRVNSQSTDGMRKQAESKDVQMQECHHEIPDEIAAGHCLDHARGTGVAPDPLLEIHILALVVNEDNP